MIDQIVDNLKTITSLLEKMQNDIIRLHDRLGTLEDKVDDMERENAQ